MTGKHKTEVFVHRMLEVKKSIIRPYLHRTEDSDSVLSPVDSSPVLDSEKVPMHRLNQSFMKQPLPRKVEATLFACVAAISIDTALKIPGLAQNYGGMYFMMSFYISLIFIVAPVVCVEMMLGQISTRHANEIFGTLASIFSGFGFLVTITRTLSSFIGGLDNNYPKILFTLLQFLFFKQTTVCNKSSGYCYEYDSCSFINQSLTDELSNITSFATTCLHPRYQRNSDNYEMIKNRIITNGTPKVDLERNSHVNTFASVILICIFVFISVRKGVVSFYKVFVIFILLIVYGFVVYGLTNYAECKNNCYKFDLKSDPSALYSPFMWKAALTSAFSFLRVGDGTFHSIGVYLGFRNNPIKTTAIIIFYATVVIFMSFFVTFAANSAAFTEFAVRDIFEWTTNNHAILIPSYQNVTIPQYLGMFAFLCSLILFQMPFHIISSNILYNSCSVFYSSLCAQLYGSLGYMIIVRVYVMWIAVGVIFTTLFPISEELKYIIRTSANFVVFAELIIIVVFYGVERLIVNLKTIVGRSSPLSEMFWTLFLLKKYIQVVVPFGTMWALCASILTCKMDTISIVSFSLIGLLFVPFIRILNLITNRVIFSRDLFPSFVNRGVWGPSNINDRKQMKYDEKAARQFI